MEWRRFVTYLWNDPRITCNKLNIVKWLPSKWKRFVLRARCRLGWVPAAELVPVASRCESLADRCASRSVTYDKLDMKCLAPARNADKSYSTHQSITQSHQSIELIIIHHHQFIWIKPNTNAKTV